jgi:hypothetical protein
MIRSLLNARSSYVWLVLVVATVLSWAIGVEHAVGSGISVLVLAIAAIKIRYVGLDFMELRTAPLPLRVAFESYCAALFLVLAGMYVWL